MFITANKFSSSSSSSPVSRLRSYSSNKQFYQRNHNNHNMDPKYCLKPRYYFLLTDYPAIKFYWNKHNFQQPVSTNQINPHLWFDGLWSTSLPKVTFILPVLKLCCIFKDILPTGPPLLKLNGFLEPGS